MYLNCTVQIPDVPGKISLLSKGKSTYVRYETGRTYHPDKKYNTPNYRTIGKLVPEDSALMSPNENFYKYFGTSDAVEATRIEHRSSCLRIGSFLVIEKIIREYGLLQRLEKQFGSGNAGFLLDLAAYSIICENNAGQYYPDYAYNHPLFTAGMHIYSDSKVSEFLSSITDDQRVGFLDEWNASRDHREKIYISYDSTNKNCQAGNLRMVEFGHPKDDRGCPVFNYAMAYDKNNREPLFYEQYPGSIVDVSQLQFMLDKAAGYGYRRVGFVLDRGYFSKDNIRYLDKCGYDCCIMVKGMLSFVKEIVLAVKGTFENKRNKSIRRHRVYGTTVKRFLYAGDTKEKYFHVYHSDLKAASEKDQLENHIERMAKDLNRFKNSKVTLSKGYSKYFELEIDEDGTFLYGREREDVIEEELSMCGYFVIMTSQKMTAEEALNLYRGRDASEKLFRGDKSYLGNRSLRIQTDESASGKIFIEFIAMLIRCKIYVLLKDEAEKQEQRQNYMTVPAAIKELDKIEMIRGYDGRYRLDHAVSARQKKILKAFHMDAESVKKRASELGDLLEFNGTVAEEGQ